MGLFGFDSVSDMFDGGGAGGKGASYSTGSHADYVANNPNDTTAKAHDSGGSFVGNTIDDVVGSVTGGGSTTATIKSGQTLSGIAAANGVTVAQLMAANPNITDPNEIQSGASINIPGSGGGSISNVLSGNSTGVKGSAPTAGIMSLTLPRVIGSFSSWVNGIDPEKDSAQVSSDGRQVYTKAGEGGMSYSYNFLGMPYEVKLIDGVAVDALSIDANGKPPTDPDYDRSTSGYERQKQSAQASGDSDGVAQITQYEQDNSNETGSVSDGRLTSEAIRDMATKAGVVANEADMVAIIADPEKFLADRNLTLADIIPEMDADATGTNLDPESASYGLGTNDGYTATSTADASKVDTGLADNPGATDYTASTTDLTDNEMMDAATGTVSDNAQVDAEKYAIDITGAATGVNADGTKNELGIAANDWASVDLSKVIDTTTVSGKLLADKLVKEGKEFVDAKTSILWQMKTIAAEFKDSNGNPVIPPWAQSMNREAMKSISFNGISGTAATAAMSNAIMESMMGVAEKEATFFQTLTVKNLDNKQESIINKAKILSNLEMANLDARSQAAVQNAKAFLQMDIANLTNEQQAEMINKQALVQSMLENTKAENAARRFSAESANDMDKFYSELAVNIQRHNTSEINALAKFNAGEINDAAQFNADMKNDRQQFLAEMQYQIDLANAKWRQNVETTNTQNEVDAHTADVKAALDLTQEAQNNLWDSADNMLDYIWKTTDNDQERELRLLLSQMQVQSGQESGGSGFMSGLLQLGGAYLGSSSGSKWLTSLLPG